MPKQMQPGAIRAGSEAAPADSRAAATQAAESRDRSKGGLKLIERIGRGTTGDVWLATYQSNGASVAVKLLGSRWITNETARSALRVEASVLECIRQPSIVAYVDWIESMVVDPAGLQAYESPALVLECLPGGDLVSLAGASASAWVRAGRDIGLALDYLHTHGIVHGDVKARNVLFDGNDRARLVDFSSARRADDTVGPLGTATQQRQRADDHIVSVDDDIYAFAALLYELVVGRAPFVHRPGVPISVLAAELELASRQNDVSTDVTTRIGQWVLSVLSSDAGLDRQALSDGLDVLNASVAASDCAH